MCSGRLRIEETLAHLTDLDYQEVPQQRRCSFFTANETVIEYVRESVAILECDVIYSAGRFLDVLPQGVNKGSSLQQLISYLGIDETEVLVAGDTLNDLAMYNCGFKGAVVGNAGAAVGKKTPVGWAVFRWDCVEAPVVSGHPFLLFHRENGDTSSPVEAAPGSLLL